MVWKGFVLTPTPFAKEFWTVRDSSDRTIARIGASVSPTRQGEGAIGFFEFDTNHPGGAQAARELLLKAESWLRAHRVTHASGPMNFNTWFPYRFRVGEPKERFSWEPENPPEYVSLWQSQGYTELETYHSQGHRGMDEMLAGFKPYYEKSIGLGFQFRSFDAAKVMEKEVPILYDISMAGFKDNFLFEPIPFEAFRALYVPISGKLDLGLANIAFHPDLGPVGFFFAYQDRDYAVYKSVAMKPEARGKGVSNGMMYWSLMRSKERGLEKIITAMVKSGAQSESYAKKAQLLWENKYALFGKKL